MDLQLFAPTSPALDTFARDVEDKRRFTAKIQSTNQSDKGVEGRMQITAVSP